MTKFLKTLWADKQGAAAAEYALILAVIGGGIAVAALTLGQSISEALGRAEAVMDAQEYTPAE